MKLRILKSELAEPIDEKNSLRAQLNFCAKTAFCLGVAVIFAGCATIRTLPTEPLEKRQEKGVYHKIRSGETLWRIADAYQVSIDDIIKSNNIPDVALVEEHQLIFIPGVDSIKQVNSNRKSDNPHEFDWPIKGKIFSYFGERKGLNSYKGINILGNEGDVVKAARDGKVVFADYLIGYAYTVILDHADQLYSVYAQNSSLQVKLNDLVYKGDPIARLGKQRNLALLHFEIRKQDSAQNPLFYLSK